MAPLKKGTFPLFIVHGDMSLGLKDRRLNIKLLSHLDEIGEHFGLIHLYDENYDHDLSIYYLAGCKLVFRNYFRLDGGNSNLLRDYCRSFFYPFYTSTKHSGLKLLGSKARNYCYAYYHGFQFMRRQYLPVLPKNKIFFLPLGYTDKFGKIEEQASFRLKNENINGVSAETALKQTGELCWNI